MQRAGLLTLAVAALASCKNDKLTVTGNLTNTGDTLLVFKADEAPDTITVKEGKFTYQTKVEAAIVLPAVPGEKAEVSGDMMGDYTITGSKFFKDFDAQQKMLKDATQDNVVELIMNHVKENPNSEAALSLISIVGYVAPDSLDSFLSLLSDKVKNGRMKPYLEEQIASVKAQAESESQAQALQAEGREVPDFTLNDLQGNALNIRASSRYWASTAVTRMRPGAVLSRSTISLGCMFTIPRIATCLLSTASRDSPRRLSSTRRVRS